MAGEELSSVRPQAYDDKTIYDWFQNAPGPGHTTDQTAIGWEDLSKDYDGLRDLVAKALTDSKAVWQGNAADAMTQAMAPIGEYLGHCAVAAQLSAISVGAQGSHFRQAQNSVQPPVTVPVQPWYQPVAFWQTDYDKAVEAKTNANLHNQQVLATYGQSSSGTAATMPDFATPAEISANVSQPGPGKVGVAGWHHGGTQPGGGGGGGSQPDGGGGAGAGGGAQPGGSGGLSGGGSPRGGVPGGGQPGGFPSGPRGTTGSGVAPGTGGFGSTGTAAASSGFGPVGSDPAAGYGDFGPGSGAGGIGSGGIGSGGIGSGGIGASGGIGGGGEIGGGGYPGSGGTGSGSGNSLGKGAMSGAAPGEGSAGRGPGGAGGAPDTAGRPGGGIPMGGTGGRSKGGEDTEHKTPLFLIHEHDSYWTRGIPPTVPPVIGADRTE